MSENQAALTDPLDKFVQEAIDQDSKEQANNEVKPTESATVEVKEEVEATIEPEATEAEKPTEDGFQKRINKVTAAKHEERRKAESEAKRADDLQKQLDELRASKPALSEPTLEQHDYDEEAFNSANVQYQIQQGVKAEIESQTAQQKQVQAQLKAEELHNSFNEQVTALNDPEFASKSQSIPELPAGVVDAIMQESNGAELVKHLYTHLDKADALANMTPARAMMELGRLSVELSAKPVIKTSAAPDPIETISSGSAIPNDIGDDMSIDAWMAKHN